jgi:hypothetical protein
MKLALALFLLAFYKKPHSIDPNLHVYINQLAHRISLFFPQPIDPSIWIVLDSDEKITYKEQSWIFVSKGFLKIAHDESHLALLIGWILDPLQGGKAASQAGYSCLDGKEFSKKVKELNGVYVETGQSPYSQGSFELLWKNL